MHSQSKRVFFKDLVFLVDENVYEPAEDSFLFAEHLDVQEHDRVLDMGTGCGILGIIAAKKAYEVVAIDINLSAIRCTIQNAKLNNVHNKMIFIQGDLFTALRDNEKFDLIFFNAPYLPTEETEGKSWIERAWSGGLTGRQVIDHFISKAPMHLKPSGQIFLLQSTLADVAETVFKFKNYGLDSCIVAEYPASFFETITLIKAKML
ncbi:MAG: class I SAM-dependent methyltransferase [Candidatus Bathyarchaeia archaeon]